MTKNDFEGILEESDFSLIRHEKLLSSENVVMNFIDEAISRLAELAFEVNDDTKNISERRLHTILEKLSKVLSYEAADIGLTTIKITPEYVDEKLHLKCY